MNVSRITNTFIKDITSLGSLPTYATISLSFLFAGFTKLFLDLLLGIMIACGVIVALRLLFFKDRPIKEMHNSILERVAAASFPSHHSANAALLFVIISSSFGGSLLSLLLFVLSISVALSRMILKKHYFIDVIIGYCIGLIIALLIITLIV